MISDTTVVDRENWLAQGEGPAPGEVWLVGAGPGDPGLLTRRAATALERADIVFHDALSGRAVLRLIHPRAERVDVGKRRGDAPVRQAEINRRLVAAALAGKRVVRLKGGDPFLFGRGFEEAEALDKADIPWRVVPGVSAGLAAPAAAGFPLTHRGVARRVTFVTGHDAEGEVPGPGTLVAFMALARLDALVLAQLAEGRDPATPVAIIAAASTPQQVVIRTTLGRCTLEARRLALPTPALVVVGEVAALPRRRPAEAPARASALA
jgi:uroporphyrin-III C-methyltransferase